MIGNFVAAALLAASITPAELPPPLEPFPDIGEPLAEVAYIDDVLEAGFENGALPAEFLTAIESSEGCLLETEAGQSWLQLEAHAARDGVELTASWCYRNIATQRRTYRRNCPRVIIAVDPPAAVPDSEEAADPGDTPPDEDAEAGAEQPAPAPKKGRRICTVPTAKPGNSNHGWGRAVDLTSAGPLLKCESDTFTWLLANAHLYGWVHPPWAACGEPKEEAWHWEWGGTYWTPPPVRDITELANFID